ncbi:MAG: hypothetical protein WCJ92_07615, partial [Alphaproteobacteria bacterium]
MNCVLFNDQGPIEQTAHGPLDNRDGLVNGVVKELLPNKLELFFLRFDQRQLEIPETTIKSSTK